MPARLRKIPSYRLHRPSGQAVVRLNGRDHYLGTHGTEASLERYHRLIAEWLTTGEHRVAADCQKPARLSVSEMILAFWRHAQTHYRAADGAPTREIDNLRDALRPVRNLYGSTHADAFGPLALRAVQLEMIKSGLCRNVINARVNRIRRAFRWAVSVELIPAAVIQALETVPGLKSGRTEAREGPPVKPVPEAFVDAVKPHVWRPVRAMIELQMLTGMRPGEVCQMRSCDLEVSGSVWIYRPESHKTQHFGHAREVYLGPQAQAILRPCLKTDLQACLFSPREAREEHFRKLRAKRKTRVQPSQVCRKRTSPRRLPGDSYTVASYRRAIARACDQAFPLPDHLAPQILPSRKRETAHAWRARLTAAEVEEVKAWRTKHRWHPHQLRHNAATELRKKHGIELARIILGHSTAFTTEIYAEQDRKAAMEVMGMSG